MKSEALQNQGAIHRTQLLVGSQLLLGLRDQQCGAAYGDLLPPLRMPAFLQRIA